MSDEPKSESEHCKKCGGEGWLWAHERDDYMPDHHDCNVDDTRYDCDACGGVVTNPRKRRSSESTELREKVERLTIALADAIRRPMGVVPDSAEGLVTMDEIDAAEERRRGP